MSNPQEFLNWISDKYFQDSSFGPPIEGSLPFEMIPTFDLVFKRKASIMKGNQYHFFKIIPPDLTIEHAKILAYERQRILDYKSSFFKMLQEFLVFIYVTDSNIPESILMVLADFRGVKKDFLGNTVELNFILETQNGTFRAPKKMGIVGVLPLRNLRNKIKRDILEPYKSWKQEFETYQGKNIS